MIWHETEILYLTAWWFGTLFNLFFHNHPNWRHQSISPSFFRGVNQQPAVGLSESSNGFFEPRLSDNFFRPTWVGGIFSERKMSGLYGIMGFSHRIFSDMSTCYTNGFHECSWLSWLVLTWWYPINNGYHTQWHNGYIYGYIIYIRYIILVVVMGYPLSYSNIATCAPDFNSIGWKLHQFSSRFPP